MPHWVLHAYKHSDFVYSDLDMNLESIRIVAFDLETSGTLIHKDCILQIG